MSTDSFYSEYGHEWEAREDESCKEQVVTAKSYDGYVDLTERDLLEMLAALRDKEGMSG